MPALLAGIAGAITAACASVDRYHLELYNIWGEMKPSIGTDDYAYAVGLLRNQTGSSLADAAKDFGSGPGRTAMQQGGYQFAAVVCTLAISIAGGAITGLLARFLDAPTGGALYRDDKFWLVGDGYKSVGGGEEAVTLVQNEKVEE